MIDKVIVIKKWKPLVKSQIKNSYLIDIFCLYMEYFLETNKNNLELNTFSLELEIAKIIMKLNDKSNYTEVKTFINIYTGGIEYRSDDFTIIGSEVKLSNDIIVDIFSKEFYNYLVKNDILI